MITRRSAFAMDVAVPRSTKRIISLVSSWTSTEGKRCLVSAAIALGRTRVRRRSSSARLKNSMRACGRSPDDPRAKGDEHPGARGARFRFAPESLPTPFGPRP